mmetsp:Transcript_84161/g.238799  ORF Transcript_84161/g.238799 Transcript_84161/m.238799 type:complete len:200 (+) Transcript_84161:183-782(+)
MPSITFRYFPFTLTSTGCASELVPWSLSGASTDGDTGIVQTTTRGPETRRVKSADPRNVRWSTSPGAAGPGGPARGVRSTAKEILLAGTLRRRSPCFAATSAKRSWNHTAFSFRSCRRRFQPAAPRDSRVMKRSRVGLMVARPGYRVEILSTSSGLGAATMAPPTGTMKFLSVLCTKASTRPRRQPVSMRCVHFEHCRP